MKGEMRMKNRKVKINSGESMVEIMVSIVIFLMMMAVMQGAISFCSNAQTKSIQIREANAEICENLETSAYASDGKATYSFNAASADGDTTGTETLFSVEVDLGRKEASDLEGKTTTFYMFGVPSGAGAGGGTP